MKRYLKFIIGVLLIAIAAGAMYFWNEKGREKAELAKAELESAIEAEQARDPYEDIYNAGMSFFPVPKAWIASYSSKLSGGNWVMIYYKHTIDNKNESDQDIEISLLGQKYLGYDAEYYGKFKVSSVAENSIEIICKLKEFTDMENLVKGEDNKLIFMMGASDD